MVRANTVLITGAAGNLGALLARSLIGSRDLTLRLMTHHRDVAPDWRRNACSWRAFPIPSACDRGWSTAEAS